MASGRKDVGVTIDNKLSFDKDITEKVNKANSIIGVIRRTFEYLDLKTFRMLYVSLARPHLEYANPVWNPYLKREAQWAGGILTSIFLTRHALDAYLSVSLHSH
jgi:hypothetical protein